MAKRDLRVPIGDVQLREYVSPQGLNLGELIDVLEMELNDQKRKYIALRLVARINKLRSEQLYHEVMKRLTL